jgi:hypothetical protein
MVVSGSTTPAGTAQVAAAAQLRAVVVNSAVVKDNRLRFIGIPPSLFRG